MKNINGKAGVATRQVSGIGKRKKGRRRTARKKVKERIGGREEWRRDRERRKRSHVTRRGKHRKKNRID